MTTATVWQTIARLKQLLSDEQDMLLSGRARDVVTLSQDKSDALKEIDTYLGKDHRGALPAHQIGQIQIVVKLASENATHFDAIRNGLRHAVDRLETLHAGAYVGAYTRNGQRVPFAEVTGRFQRKV